VVTDSPTLTIRGLQSDDWLAIQTLYSHPLVLQNSFELPYASDEAFRERIANPPASDHTLIANVTLASGRERIVGVAWVHVMVHRRRHTGRVEVVLHPDYYGTAFEDGLLRAVTELGDYWLGLRRLETVVFAADHARLAAFERHGFVREATISRFAFRAGEYAEAVLLARLLADQAGAANAQQGERS